MSTARIDGTLVVEHNAGRYGIGNPRPRLSWAFLTRDPSWAQEAYELEATFADGTVRTEKVSSADQVLVPWPFPALESRQRLTLRVRASAQGVWTDFSEPATIEAGLLEVADWQARFISPSSIGGVDQPAPLLFTQAHVREGLVSARLYVTAKGSYEFSINGERVGNEVLAPGWTSYAHRLRYQTHDVTALLSAGRNDLRAVLGNGWYRGQLGWEKKREHYGSRLSLLAQLELLYADGTTDIVATDAAWQATKSNVLSDDIYDGQRTDLRTSNDPAGKNADAVDVLEDSLAVLVAPEGPPVRITETISATNVFTSPSGKLLADFGQNLVGWVRLTVRGMSDGDEVTIRHAEVLEHGELGIRPLRNAKATDSYLLSGATEQVLEPTFTFHGFRYAEITGLDRVDPRDVTAVVVGSDLRRTGWFECSDQELNQLHQNVVWGMRGNFVDVPTDCPQRDERLGWTGDIQAFSPTASFLFDTNGFLSSWLKDLAADQYQDGTVPFVIPDVLRVPDLPAATAWGDAATIVPWVLYERFGDLDVLRQQYPSMKGWVDRIAGLAGENHLWEGGFQFGDWLDPTAQPEEPANAQADPDVIATAYLIRSAGILSRAARLLGNNDDAEHYLSVSNAARQAFNGEYVTGSGRVLSDCQTVYALALVWDLLETDDQRKHAANRLADLVRTAAFRVSTGFVGTPLILDALTSSGSVDLAYRMLQEKGNPSWLYPVTMGATTIWERWDSMLPDGTINPGEMTSFNHYALGAVADWMHRTIAGLAPTAAAYREIEIKPQPGGDLTYAAASHDSPYGRIAVKWTFQEGVFTLSAEIPPGVTARVVLPGAERALTVLHGTHSWQTRFALPDPVNRGDSMTLGELVADDTLFKPITTILLEHQLVSGQMALSSALSPRHDALARDLLDVLNLDPAAKAKVAPLVENILTA